MKILSVLVILFIILAVICFGAALLVLLAYFTGQLINPILEFSLFQATVLSFVGMAVFVLLISNLFKLTLPYPFSEYPDHTDEDDDNYGDDDYDDNSDDGYGPPYITHQPSKAKPKAKRRRK